MIICPIIFSQFKSEGKGSVILSNSTDQNSNKGVQPKSTNLSRGKIIAIIVLAAAIIVACILMNHFIVNPSHFPEGSTINGVSVSGMTVKEAESKLTDEWNTKSITIKYHGKKVGTIKKFDFSYNITSKVKGCLHPGIANAIARTFAKSKRNYTIQMTPAKSTKHFNKQFQALSIVRNGKGTVTTEDAYVDMSNTKFKIVHEVYGNNLDEDKLQSALFKSIANNKKTFNYKAKKYYAVPTLKYNSKKVIAKQKYCKKYLTQKIVYKAPLKTYTIAPYDLDKMITVSDDKVTVNEKEVKSFVKRLAFECDSVGATRTIDSPADGTVTVSGGTYGYTISVSKETKKLIEDLKSGKDVKRSPVYSQTGRGTSGNDIGNSYVEVDISSQTCYCIINGKVVLSTDVVTGNTSEGHGTPTGVYYIIYTTTNETLKGRNNDGSSYATKVKYWMPFYNGDGLHDAWWRNKFGGTIYKTGGSHGCVNMPSSAAAKLYSYASTGMPVVIHN